MKKTKPTQERRQNARFRILSLLKHATEPDVVTLQVTNIQNVSSGGLAFFADQEIKEGVVLQLHFLPPNREKPVAAKGKVVRCPQVTPKEKVFEVGVQFLDVSEDGKLAIRELEAFFLENPKKAKA